MVQTTVFVLSDFSPICCIMDFSIHFLFILLILELFFFLLKPKILSLSCFAMKEMLCLHISKQILETHGPSLKSWIASYVGVLYCL